MKKSRTAHPIAAVESPTVRTLPLVELLVDTKTELVELMVRSGLRVLDAMLEEDRTALCGPRYAHQATRTAARAGTVPSEVVLGGRKITVARPRVRAAGREVPLPTFQTLAHEDPLNRRVVEQMLVGVATRQYARSLEPVPAGVVSRGTSKSSVSRRFVAKTTAQLRAWQSAPLDGLDLVALLVDGVHIGEHCLVVALGIAADGQKHALGVWEGATENAAVCQGLLANLQSRGLRTDRSLLVILDGALALHKATRAVFGEAALIQRCQIHKLRNILDHLPERQRPWVQAVVRRAYQATDLKVATRLLTDLAKRLDDEYPSAAGSVREGLEETLTVLTLHLSARLQRSLATTNAAESLLSRTRHVKRNVKRWRGGQMMLRWVAAGVLEAVKGFRRLKGHADMPRLVAALRARDQRLGLGVSGDSVEENVA
jgi:putative transposase